MIKINDGGPAYPHIEENGDGSYTRHSGLSLRDYFAAAALQGELAAQSAEEGFWSKGLYPNLAENSYAIADAMLAARTKGGAS